MGHFICLLYTKNKCGQFFLVIYKSESASVLSMLKHSVTFTDCNIYRENKPLR